MIDFFGHQQNSEDNNKNKDNFDDEDQYDDNGEAFNNDDFGELEIEFNKMNDSRGAVKR